MTQRESVTFVGKSGIGYHYFLYSTDFPLPKNLGSGNYVFINKYKTDQGYDFYKPVYFGVADDLYEEVLDNYEKMLCPKQNGANIVGVFRNDYEKDRKAQQKDLIAKYKTVCNEVNK